MTVRINIPKNFMERYNEIVENPDTKDSKKEKYENLKESYDKALEIRDSVLEYAEKMQYLDNYDRCDAQPDRRGKVVVEDPDITNYTGNLTFDTNKNKEEQIKPGKEDAQYEALQDMTVSTINNSGKEEFYNEDIEVAHMTIEAEYSMNTQTQYSYEQPDEINGILDSAKNLLGLKQEADVFEVKETTGQVFEGTRNWADKIEVTERAHFNKDGSITLMTDDEYVPRTYGAQRAIFNAAVGF
jgi:hypothetical protein